MVAVLGKRTLNRKSLLLGGCGFGEEDNCGLLPVDLMSFTVELKNQQVYLNWQTASEINNFGFHVQRSRNGVNWEVIGFVPSHDPDGTTNQELFYEFVDWDDLGNGIVYYRLLQEDWDRNETIHQVVSVLIKRQGIPFSIFPNPASDYVIIMVEGIEDVSHAVFINVLGQRFNLPVANGQVDITNLYDGQHFVRLI